MDGALEYRVWKLATSYLSSFASLHGQSHLPWHTSHCEWDSGDTQTLIGASQGHLHHRCVHLPILPSFSTLPIPSLFRYRSPICSTSLLLFRTLSGGRSSTRLSHGLGPFSSAILHTCFPWRRVVTIHVSEISTSQHWGAGILGRETPKITSQVLPTWLQPPVNWKTWQDFSCF